MTLGVASCLIAGALAAIPLAIDASPFVRGLAVVVLVLWVGATALRSVPLATAACTLALVEYALALVIARTPVDVMTGAGVGLVMLLLLQLVHFRRRVHGAQVGRAVLRSQLVAWLTIAGLGAVAAVLASAGGALLREGVLARAPLPAIVVASAIGAVATAAGVIALIAFLQGPSSR